MDILKSFASKLLKSADLEDDEFTLVISKVETETVGDQEKPVLYFQDSKRALSLNKTNAVEIASAYGKETESWTGKSVVLYKAKTLYQGQPVNGIRIRIPSDTSGLVPSIDLPF